MCARLDSEVKVVWVFQTPGGSRLTLSLVRSCLLSNVSIRDLWICLSVFCIIRSGDSVVGGMFSEFLPIRSIVVSRDKDGVSFGIIAICAMLFSNFFFNLIRFLNSVVFHSCYCFR